MNLVRNLNYANRKNPVWQQANRRANRYLYKLLLKEVLKMLPVMLLFKVRLYQKFVVTTVIALLVLLLFALENNYAQAGFAGASFIHKKIVLNGLYIKKLRLVVQNGAGLSY